MCQRSQHTRIVPVTTFSAGHVVGITNLEFHKTRETLCGKSHSFLDLPPKIDYWLQKRLSKQRLKAKRAKKDGNGYSRLEKIFRNDRLAESHPPSHMGEKLMEKFAEHQASGINPHTKQINEIRRRTGLVNQITNANRKRVKVLLKKFL